MMDERLLFTLGLAGWAVFAVLLGLWFVTVTPANLAVREKMPRWRWAGAVVGAAALALTVPQIQAILFDWLVPWYIPAIAAFWLLSVWKLDYLMARALAGLVMMAAYYFLYASFALSAWCAPVGAVMAWIVGLAGILVAAKPCWLRDAVRWAARHAWGGMLIAGGLWLTAVYAAAAAVLS